MNRYIDKIQRLINIFYLIGDNVICEMCNWKGRKFPKNRCPKCNSLPRTRLIPFSINYFNINKKRGNVLHIAPNVSEYNYILNNIEFKNYDRLDINGKMKQINIVADLTNTNLPDKNYDLIIIWHVLEHISDDHQAIKEMYRMLKSAGELLVSVPIYPNFRAKTFEDDSIERKNYEEVHGHDDHCRSCGLDYFERFEKHGFKTKTLNVNELKSNYIDKFGLSQGHTVWLFTK